MKFSPDGNRLASASADKTCRIWDTLTFFQLAVMEGHAKVVPAPWQSSLACDTVTSCRQTLALMVGELDLADPSFQSGTGRPGLPARLLMHQQPQACQPSMRLCWQHPQPGTQSLHASLSCSRSASLQGVSDVAWHPSGKHIATASDDNTLKLWVSSSGELLKTLAGHTHYVFCCAFSPKGNLLASGSFDETIRIWDFSNGQCLKVSRATRTTCSFHTGLVAVRHSKHAGKPPVQPGSLLPCCILPHQSRHQAHHLPGLCLPHAHGILACVASRGAALPLCVPGMPHVAAKSGRSC